MKYAVYEDDVTRRARVHPLICSHYRKRKKITLPDNRWHDEEPYSLDEALRIMGATDKANTGLCPTVNP